MAISRKIFVLTLPVFIGLQAGVTCAMKEPEKLFSILENSSISESQKIEFLHHSTDKDTMNKNGYALLCIAANNGLFSVVKLLIERGANPNKTQNPYPPLACQIASFNIPIARYLRLHGTNINNPGTHKLFNYLVADGNNLAAIITFVELGLDISTYNNLSNLPYKAGRIYNYLMLAQTLYGIEAKQEKPEKLTQQLNIKDPTQTRLKCAIRLAIAQSLIRVMKQLYIWNKSRLAKVMPLATGFASEMPVLDNHPGRAFYRYLLGPALILNNFPLIQKILTRYPDISWHSVITDKPYKKLWEESDKLFKKQIRTFVTTKYALLGIDLATQKEPQAPPINNTKTVSLPPVALPPEIVNHVLGFLQIG